MTQPPDTFPAWGPDHIGALTAIGVWILLAALATRLLSPATRKTARVVAALLCLTGLSLGVAVELGNPAKSWPEAIPFHLCSVSLALTAFALLRRSPLAFEWIYVFGIAGVIQALLTPDLPSGFPSFKYLLFFFNHGAILAGLAYLMGCEGMRPRPGTLVRLWVYGTAYMFSAIALNSVFGTNFGYLARKPDNPSLLDMLGPWPVYILWMQALGVAQMALLMLPFRDRWALLFGRPNFQADLLRPDEQSRTH